MTKPRTKPEMVEGKEAFERFENAMRAIIKVPKSALPPSPFGKSKRAGAKEKSPKSK
jgi:hypothetical protein